MTQSKVHQIRPFQREYQEMRLKHLAVACGISQGELAEAGDVSRAAINLCLNHSFFPQRPGFQEIVEAWLITGPRGAQVMAWLDDQGLRIKQIWETAPTAPFDSAQGPDGERSRTAPTLRGAHPSDFSERMKRFHKQSRPAFITGEPENITTMEVEMLKPETMKQFRLFRDPFLDDVQKDGDVYMGDDHRYIEAAMLDAARHGAFLAVVGESGCGKSTMRKKVREQLKRDNDVLVIFPQVIDKQRLTAASICDAIIQDVSSEKCKAKLEDKARQVHRLLLDRSKSGYRSVLIIEEAHDLLTPTLKYLKRFYELEDGYKKLLGIILIGQTELKERLNERVNYEMREVIRRLQVAEIGPLTDIRGYLELKFKRVGSDVTNIFAEDAFEELSRKLTTVSRDGKTRVSHSYPSLVHAFVIRAMNLAHELGEARVTAEVVAGI